MVGSSDVLRYVKRTSSEKFASYSSQLSGSARALSTVRNALECHHFHVSAPIMLMHFLTLISFLSPESRTLFFEFMSKSGGAALFTSQASRVASLSSVSLQSDPALIAELQEMSYLLYHFLVGTGDLVHNEARKKVIFMLLQASASAPGRGRSDSLDHMVHVLEIEQLFFAQWRAMQAWLSKCRCRGCDTRLSTGYGVQCTRYVGEEIYRRHAHIHC